MPDGRPLYQHQLDALLAACSGSPQVFVSLARDSALDTTLRDAVQASSDELAQQGRIRVIHDLEDNSTDTSAGPAAGLLAAHKAYPNSTWLVLACDYPFVTATALKHLQSMYVPPVTCFVNSEGFCESLIGIWSPMALQHLAKRHEEGSSGPSRVVKELDGLMIRPPQDQNMLLCNVNTESEWESAVEELRKTHGNLSASVAS